MEMLKGPGKYFEMDVRVSRDRENPFYLHEMFQKRFEVIKNVKVLKLKRKLGRFISKN